MIDCTLLAIALALAAQEDPLRTIRSMADRGEYADAAEAIEGLPGPHRDRERALLSIRMFALDLARESASRVLEADRDDVEMLRIVGDVDFIEGNLESAREHYARARAALAKDFRLSDADRAAWGSALDQRGSSLALEDDYRDRMTAAERRTVWLACALTFGVATGTAMAFRAAIRFGSAEELVGSDDRASG